MTRETLVLDTVGRLAVRPFAFGSLDCCLFAADVAGAITGEDYRGRFNYRTEDEAADIVRKFGGLRELIDAVLPDSTFTTRRDELELGDPVLLRVPIGGELVGVKWRGDDAMVKTTRYCWVARGDYIRGGWHVG